MIWGFGLIAGVLLAIGSGVWAERGDDSLRIPAGDIRSFTEVFGKIKEIYVEEISDQELLENGIRGMLTGLDPHSSYLDRDAFKELRESTSGQFGGLGIVVGMEDGFVKVISPIDDTPAAQAGIESGDLIIRLDEKPVKGMSLDDAVKIMRGAPGTPIKLLIVRKGADKPLEVEVTRAVIRVKSVKYRMLEPGFGYVRITQFQSRTGADLMKAIQDLETEYGGKLKGLVLDLRNNPGGLLDAAIRVSDAFLSKGNIVSVKGRSERDTQAFDANTGDILEGAPIVVLVNGGSASASEIVAGALQDQKRAVIMGSKTFGKGSVQTVVPLNNNTAIKLTTARYYTPSGGSIQAKGIVPDIVLEDFKLTKNKNNGFDSLKESDLSGHLENDSDLSKDKNKDDKEKKPDTKEDFALYEALNLLKGVALFGAQ